MIYFLFSYFQSLIKYTLYHHSFIHSNISLLFYSLLFPLISTHKANVFRFVTSSLPSCYHSNATANATTEPGSTPIDPPIRLYALVVTLPIPAGINTDRPTKSAHVYERGSGNYCSTDPGKSIYLSYWNEYTIVVNIIYLLYLTNPAFTLLLIDKCCPFVPEPSGDATTDATIATE